MNMTRLKIFLLAIAALVSPAFAQAEDGDEVVVLYNSRVPESKMVADHYAKLGFALISKADTGETHWELRVASAEPESAPMKVVSQDFSSPDQQSAA